jgi:hypothetical protein
MCSPHPPCAWLPSVLRRPRPALRGVPSASPVRSCDRSAILSCGSAFFRVPSGSPCPPPRAPLLGFWPPSLRAFSARRTGTFAGRRLHARGVSSCAGRLPPSPPEGVACRRRWTLARHLSCAFRARGRSRVRAALQSLLRRRRSLPLSKPRSPFEVLGSSSYRPTKTTLSPSRSRRKQLTNCPQFRAHPIAFWCRALVLRSPGFKNFSHGHPQPVETARRHEG